MKSVGAGLGPEGLGFWSWAGGWLEGLGFWSLAGSDIGLRRREVWVLLFELSTDL